MSDLVGNENEFGTAEAYVEIPQGDAEYGKRKKKKQGSFSNIVLIILIVIVVVLGGALVISSLTSKTDPKAAKAGLEKTWQAVKALPGEWKTNFGNVLMTEKISKADGRKELLVNIKDLNLPDLDGYNMDELKRMSLKAGIVSDSEAGKMNAEIAVMHDGKEYFEAECYGDKKQVLLDVPQAYDEVILLEFEKLLELLQNEDILDLPVSFAGIDLGTLFGGSDKKEDKTVIDFAPIKEKLQKETKKLLSSAQYVELERANTSVPTYLEVAQVTGIVITEKKYSEYINNCIDIFWNGVKDTIKEKAGETIVTLVDGFLKEGKGDIVDGIKELIGGDFKLVVSLNSAGYANYISTKINRPEEDYLLEISATFAGKALVTDNTILEITDNQGKNIKLTLSTERSGTYVSAKGDLVVFKERSKALDASFSMLTDTALRTVNAVLEVRGENGAKLMESGVNIACETIKEEGKEDVEVIDVKSLRFSGGGNVIDLQALLSCTTEKGKVEKPSGTAYDVGSLSEESLQEFAEEMANNLETDSKLEALKSFILYEWYLNYLNTKDEEVWDEDGYDDLYGDEYDDLYDDEYDDLYGDGYEDEYEDWYDDGGEEEQTEETYE